MKRAFHRALIPGAAAVACMVVACADRGPAPLDAIAEGYVRAALQAARHQPDLVEAFHGPEGWRPHARVPVADIARAIDDLQTRLTGEGPRVAYLRGQLAALRLATDRLLGRTRPFREEFTLAFGAPWPTVRHDEVAQTRSAIEVLLPDQDALPSRYHRWRQSRWMAAPHRHAAFEAAIQACRRAVTRHVPLPHGERVDVEWVAGLGWEALATPADPLRTVVRVDADARRTADDVRRLACHETYGGHHTQHVLVARALVRDRGWLEFSLVPGFGPHLFVAEGAAEAGADLTLEPTEEDAGIERHVRTLDQVIPDIVADYLDGALAHEAALLKLREEALLPHPEQFLAFAERHRLRAVVYPIARRVVWGFLARGAGTTAADSWGRLASLFTTTPFALE